MRSTLRTTAWLLLAIVGLPVCCTPASAADFRRIDIGPERSLVLIEGMILPGDTDRLTRFLLTSLDNHHLAAFALSSPGGVVGEGARLGELIRRIDAAVVVGAHADCESACFLLFAAGARRAAMPSARIGIHSAENLAGDETTGAMAATLEMARLSIRWGVPDEIVSRMISTGPASIAFLTPAELRRMNVTIGNAS